MNELIKRLRKGTGLDSYGRFYARPIEIEAAYALESARAQLEQHSWFSVGDGLPDTTQIVICAFEDGSILPVTFRHPDQYMAKGFRWIGSEGEASGVTHWMPLPDSPLPTKGSALTSCKASSGDGECIHPDCPQLNPATQQETCPLPWAALADDEDEAAVPTKGSDS